MPNSASISRYGVYEGIRSYQTVPQLCLFAYMRVLSATLPQKSNKTILSKCGFGNFTLTTGLLPPFDCGNHPSTQKCPRDPFDFIERIIIRSEFTSASAASPVKQWPPCPARAGMRRSQRADRPVSRRSLRESFLRMPIAFRKRRRRTVLSVAG